MGTLESTHIGPSSIQKAWMALRFGMFIHFSLSTFYHLEGGTGEEDPSRFDPVDFDPNQWAEAAAAGGMKYDQADRLQHHGHSDASRYPARDLSGIPKQGD